MRWLSVAGIVACGCMTPRSIMLGEMAAPLGKGVQEIAVGAGVGYAQQVAPAFNTPLPNGMDVQQNQQISHAFALPGVEGNAQFGLGDHLALNAHLSSAGLQPGLKITVNGPRDRAHFALLPSFALGYASYGQSTNVTGPDGVLHSTAPSGTTSFTFMLGLKAIVSVRGGFYAGVGYDLILTRSVTTGQTGSGNSTTDFSNLTTSIQHQLTLNVGFTVEVGFLRIRPEIALGIIPAISQSFTQNDMTTGGSGGYGWVIMPGFVIAAATPKPARDEDEPEREEKNDEERTNEGQE
jgi:hypothetical protein